MHNLLRIREVNLKAGVKKPPASLHCTDVRFWYPAFSSNLRRASNLRNKRIELDSSPVPAWAFNFFHFFIVCDLHNRLVCSMLRVELRKSHNTL